MESSCTEKTSYINENELDKLHEKYKLEAKRHLAGKLEGAQSSSINPLNTGMSYEDTLEEVGLHLNVAHRILLWFNPDVNWFFYRIWRYFTENLKQLMMRRRYIYQYIFLEEIDGLYKGIFDQMKVMLCAFNFSNLISHPM